MKTDTCVHYTGALNPRTKVCKEGIDYRALAGGDSAGWVTRLPCCALEARGGEKVTCAKFRSPTAEEIAEDKRVTDAHMKKFMIAFTGAVRAWREAQKWSRTNKVAASGKVPCEACGKGEIHLRMAAYNGHVWGKCTTEGCVSWME